MTFSIQENFPTNSSILVQFHNVRSIYNKNEQDELIEEVRLYLKKLDNMITDYVDDTFEMITGKSVR